MTALGFILILLTLMVGAGAWGILSEKRRERQFDPDTCSQCRYDLRGRAIANSICPECGQDQTKEAPVLTGQMGDWLRSIAMMLLMIAICIGIPIAILFVVIFAATMFDPFG